VTQRARLSLLPAFLGAGARAKSNGLGLDGCFQLLRAQSAAAPAQHIIGKGRGAEHANRGESEAQHATLIPVQTFAEEQGEAGTEHAASGGNPEQLGEWKFDVFHDSDESSLARVSRCKDEAL
jgi:hypothetical protein